MHEAVLGARIDVPSLDGPVRAADSAGHAGAASASGCAGAARRRRPAARGDLIVEVRIVLPAIVDERRKELMREFGRLNGEDVRRDLHV